MRPIGKTLKRLTAALATGAALILPIAANAAEAILFDGNNCSGQYRMLDRSVSDFNQIGFDNEVNSLMVVTGTFRFYRDANYGEGNGPSFQLGPSGYSETCWSLNDASQGNFPNDRMSAAQLIQDGGDPQPPGVAILYNNNNFGGQYRILTRDVSNFNNIGFDNAVNSIRVISGSWTFYRNNNYDAPPNRPSITLGPGDYANVANVPGYPPNHFPADLMSSAQVAANNTPPPPPPPPLQCNAGEVQGDTQCIPCAQFNGVPNQDGTGCVCQPGYEAGVTGTLDGLLIEVCTPVQAPPPPPPDCPGPYQILDPASNQCVFQCHQSTQPNPQTGQCDCLPGTEQAGVLNDGRRYCLASAQPPQQPQIVRNTVPGDQLIPAAQAAGFQFFTQVDQGGATCQVNGNTIIFQMVNQPDNKPRTCMVTMFAGRQLSIGWQYEDYNMTRVLGQATPYGSTTAFPFTIRLIIPPFGDKVIARIESVDLLGPNGQNWQQALQ